MRSLRALLDRLDAASIEVDALSVRSADLDDVFLSLTGRRDGAEAPVAADPDPEGGRPMIAYPVVDSMTMLRRSLRRMRRYPSLTFFIAVLPVVFLLLFVFVLGGAMGAGLGAAAPAGGRDAYLAYVMPGILVAHRGRRRRPGRRSRSRWT